MFVETKWKGEDDSDGQQTQHGETQNDLDPKTKVLSNQKVFDLNERRPAFIVIADT